MNILLSVAIAPVVLLLIYIYQKDVVAKEPTSMLVKAIFGGIGSAIAVIVLSLIFSALGFQIPTPFAETDSNAALIYAAFVDGFIEAGIPEELFKFLFLFWIVWNSKAFDEHFDGIVYAVFVSMGFAGLENIFYVFDGGIATGIMRAITAVPGHFLFAVVMGYYFSLAKFGPKHERTKRIAQAIAFPMIVHGTYDTIIFLGTSMAEKYDWAILISLAVFVMFIFKLWKHGFRRIRELSEKDQLDPPKLEPETMD